MLVAKYTDFNWSLKRITYNNNKYCTKICYKFHTCNSCVGLASLFNELTLVIFPKLQSILTWFWLGLKKDTVS